MDTQFVTLVLDKINHTPKNLLFLTENYPLTIFPIQFPDKILIQTFNFSNIICSLCFPQFNENFTSFEKFETGIFQEASFPSDGSTFPPSFSNQKNPTLWEQLGCGPESDQGVWLPLAHSATKSPNPANLPQCGKPAKGVGPFAKPSPFLAVLKHGGGRAGKLPFFPRILRV